MERVDDVSAVSSRAVPTGKPALYRCLVGRRRPTDHPKDRVEVGC